MKLPLHGSNPHYLYEALERPVPEQYIDFSANINPIGPPAELKEKWQDIYQQLSVYPDPAARKMKELIAKQEGISVNSILIGNGGAELISLVGRLLSGKKVLLIEPTFSEYEKVCRANDCDIYYHQLQAPDFDLLLSNIKESLIGVDAVVICNPNNPTGNHYDQSTMITIIEECKKNHCLVIIDEAFYDFLLEYESMIPYINRFSNLIIIRSMTKMFAIPGIRLGYLAADPAIVLELSKWQPEWSINIVAQLTGELCLQNKAFIKNTQEYINQERTRLSEFFHDYLYITSPSKVNFYLLQDPLLDHQFPLFEFLLDRGIIPRHTLNFPGLEGKWLRFAIKKVEENNQLLKVLIEWRKLHSFS